jgi:hypothetical protein
LIVRPPNKVSKPTTSYIVELAVLFFKSIREPYGIVAAILLSVFLGFLAVGVFRSEFNALALWLSAPILICALGIAVLGIILDYKIKAYAEATKAAQAHESAAQAYKAATLAESTRLRAGFAQTLATAIFYIVDGAATNTRNEEAQSEPYVALLTALARKNSGEDEASIEFKRHMDRTVKDLARENLSKSMLERVRVGVEAQRSQIDVLPDDA